MNNNSNGGDGNSEAVEEFLGADWEKLAEFGQVSTSKLETLFHLKELAIFWFFYFDLQNIEETRLIRMALSNFWSKLKRPFHNIFGRTHMYLLKVTTKW